MPRMIDDELFDAVAEDLKHCKHGESDFREDFLRAPSVELLDLGKVERWDFLDREDDARGWYRESDGEWVRFSDLQSLVLPQRWIQVSEELPEMSTSEKIVWVWGWCSMGDGSPYSGGLVRYTRGKWKPEGSNSDCNVTHWQPIPPPPKAPQ